MSEQNLTPYEVEQVYHANMKATCDQLKGEIDRLRAELAEEQKQAASWEWEHERVESLLHFVKADRAALVEALVAIAKREQSHAYQSLTDAPAFEIMTLTNDLRFCGDTARGAIAQHGGQP